MIEVTVEEIDGYCNQPMLVGDSFFVENSQIIAPDGICMWAIQSMMPAFQCIERKDQLSEDDWLNSAEKFQCPDPNGEVKYKIEHIEEND